MIPFDCKSVWAAMEDCHRLGLAKSIGVSNFSCNKIQDMFAFATILPAVNQVEMNPCWQQKRLIDLCKEKGIVVTAYSPLGAVGTSWGSNRVVDNPVLNDIAKPKGKTVPQVCLRWAYQQGVGIVVKSYRPERMVENRSIFDWELSEEECKKISEIPQSRSNRGEQFVSEDGPIKSVEDLWDGEL
ncbi:oxidoreductase superfamily protein [Perilla frutescens var. frutescens]|nr:oxidoreductase superfamily protein [Perilla frutescens var. frutescens]